MLMDPALLPGGRGSNSLAAMRCSSEGPRGYWSAARTGWYTRVSGAGNGSTFRCWAHFGNSLVV